MNHIGEIISLVVAGSWTVTALFADKASHRNGSMSANVLRLALAIMALRWELPKLKAAVSMAGVALFFLL